MGAKTNKATKRFQKTQKKKEKLAVTKPNSGKLGKKPLQTKGRPTGHGKPMKHGSGSKRHTGASSQHANGLADAPGAKSGTDMDIDAFLDGGFEDLAVGSGSGSEEEDQMSDLEEGGSDLGSEEDQDLDGSEDEEDDGEGVAGGSDAEEEEEVSEELADEGAAAAAGDPVARDNTRLRGEVARHKAQLDALKEKDPEFWAYLQQTDAGLLGFGADEDDDEDDEAETDEEESESENEESAGGKQQAQKDKKDTKKKAGDDGGDEDEADEADDDKPSSSGRTLVTSALVTMWVKSVRATGSLASLKQLCRAYRLACHYGDAEAQMEDNLHMASGSVYNAVMMFMLKEGDQAFRRCLGLPETDAPDKPLTDKQITKCARWKKVGPLVKSYLGNTLHALSAMTDPPLIAFALRRLRVSVPFMTPQPLRKFGDKLLKAALQLWGTSEAAAPRLQAFLVVRQLALSMPHPFIDKVLRAAYKTFLANAKFVSAASAPHIAFMVTCAVELWGLDMQASYAHAFAAIRQLAISLRGALNMKTKDAYKEIYSWQGVNALELWARVLAAHAAQPALRPLVYPTVQLLLGAARLVPTARFFPLRLRLLRATHRLALATQTYVPLAAPLLDMLHWAELSKAPKGGAGSSPDLSLMLRAGKNALRTSGFQEEVITQLLELLCEHLSQWACHPALPELSHLACLQLRRFAKLTKVDRFRKAAKGLLDALDRNISWVGRARDQADFAPRDVPRVNSFLTDQADKAPLRVYAKQLAAKASQRAAARSTDRVDLKAGKAGRGGDDDDEDDDMPVGSGSGDMDEDDEGGVANGVSDSDEGEDDDSGSEGEAEAAAAATKAAGKQKQKGKTKGDSASWLSSLEGSGDEDAEDQLAEYQLSSDDDDDSGDGAMDDEFVDEEGNPKQASAGKGSSLGKRPASQALDSGSEEDGSDDDMSEEGDEDASDDDDEDEDDDQTGGMDDLSGSEEMSEDLEEGEDEDDGGRPPPAKRQAVEGGAGGRGFGRGRGRGQHQHRQAGRHSGGGGGDTGRGGRGSDRGRGGGRGFGRSGGGGGAGGRFGGRVEGGRGGGGRFGGRGEGGRGGGRGEGGRGGGRGEGGRGGGGSGGRGRGGGRGEGGRGGGGGGRFGGRGGGSGGRGGGGGGRFGGRGGGRFGGRH